MWERIFMSRIKKTESVTGQIKVLKGCLLWIVMLLFLFSLIGLTASLPIYRSSGSMVTNFTSQWKSPIFSYFFSMENRQFATIHQEEVRPIRWSDFLLQLATNIKPDDARSLLGRELPGFYAYDQKIIVAREGTSYADLPIESAPPINVVLEERDAITEDEERNETPDEQLEQTTEGRDVVFIYNTHNRESFLPHLDNTDDPNAAFHQEVNVTMVSDRLKDSLVAKGIGAQVDHTDFTSVLHENGWEYWQSYQASKPVVEEALAGNSDIQYVFDIHRDSRRKEATTTTINGEGYASLFFIIGKDYQDNQKNIEMATKIHQMLEEKYPGLSLGVIEMGGSGRNGVYNQNLSDNAILIEFGGVDNTLNELYRSADALAEVFADYYWDAAAVQANE